MKNFCYWQEDVPDYIQLEYLMKLKKICLLRQMEYKIEKESGITNKTNIFCPYTDKNQPNEYDCIVGIKINNEQNIE